MAFSLPYLLNATNGMDGWNGKCAEIHALTGLFSLAGKSSPCRGKYRELGFSSICKCPFYLFTLFLIFTFWNSEFPQGIL